MMRTLVSLLWLAASPAPAASIGQPVAGPPAVAPTSPPAGFAPAQQAAPVAPTRAAAPAATPQAVPAKTAPAAAPTPPEPVAPADADQRMDRGLELLHAKEKAHGAAVLYSLYAALPETDLRRDAAAFRLAGALVDLGFVQAGI